MKVVVGYIRLSRDEDKENYSSIENQQSILNDYAKTKGWKISMFYIDDNYSGYTFDRPAFKELDKALEIGKMDIILAKDLSRIGRHSAWTQIFIEKVQKAGKTIILPEEGKGYNSDIEDDILGIKTWYNEMYVKDISRKIRASMSSKQKNGELIMGNYYGYTKTKIDNKYYLTIDEEVKPTIEMIFKSYANGLGYKKICDMLEENNSPTPSEYIRQQHEARGRVFKNAMTTEWHTHMIARIIHNDVYIGTLRTKKRHAKLIKGKQTRVPLESQYVFPNHHEAIISTEDFEIVQNISKRKIKSNFRDTANYDYIFSGFVVCKECGYMAIGLNLAKNPIIRRGYNCTTYHRYGKERCSNHMIREEELLIHIKEYLKDIKEYYRVMLLNIDVEEKKKDVTVNLDKLKKQLTLTQDELKLVLYQKIKDLMKETDPLYRQIVEETYNNMETEKKNKINELNQKIIKTNEIIHGDIKTKLTTAMDIIDRIIASDKPEKKLLELAILKIYLLKDRSIEVDLRADIFILIDG